MNIIIYVPAWYMRKLRQFTLTEPLEPVLSSAIFYGLYGGRRLFKQKDHGRELANLEKGISPLRPGFWILNIHLQEVSLDIYNNMAEKQTPEN